MCSNWEISDSIKKKKVVAFLVAEKMLAMVNP